MFTEVRVMHVYCLQDDYAIRAYQKYGNYAEIASIQQRQGNYEGAIQTLLSGKLFSAALELAVEYSRSYPDMPVKPECSVNEVAFLTAEHYMSNKNEDLAIDCVKNHFSKVKDKVSFFKGNGFIRQAIETLYEEQQYDDLYRLLKAQGRFSEGAEKSLGLQDDYNYCVFLLLLVKSKLYSNDSNQKENKYGKKSRARDVTELEKASRKIKDVELKIEIELFIGLIKNDTQICLRVCKKIRNQFGVIEALNAALKFSYTLSQSIEIALKCLQDARNVIDAFKVNFLPEKVAGELLKFYGFEKSGERYYLPPQQFYWLPELAEHSFDVRDSDGMIQLRESDVHSTVREHIVNSARQWLNSGKLDLFLYGSINSNPLNAAIMKPDKDFAMLCSRNPQELSGYIKCCTQLIVLGDFYHLLDSKLSSKVENFRSVDHMISSGASRIVNIFSNQWNFYLALGPSDFSKVQSSPLVCREVNACIDNFLTKKSYVPTQDINGFLYKWLILKVTDTSIIELESTLKEQERDIKESKTHSPLLIEERKADNTSDYIHSFMIWSQACNLLAVHGNIMEFSSKVIKRFILFNAKMGENIPKISVLNAVTLLEIVSIGLLGVLQASAVHLDYDKVPIIVPEFYCHAVQLFDNIHCSEKNVHLLTAACKAVVSIPIKKLANLNKDSYKLLYLIIRLLVGLHLPYFNILAYALARSAPNNGFERCFVLSTCLFANLAPLISRKHNQLIHFYLCSLMKDIPNDYAELKAVVYRISKANDTNEIYHALLGLQQKYNKGMVSMTYNHSETKFEFCKVSATDFPTFTLGAVVENIPPVQSEVTVGNLSASSTVAHFPMAVPSLPMRRGSYNDVHLSQADITDKVNVIIPSTQALHTVSSNDTVVSQSSGVISEVSNDSMQTSPVLSQVQPNDESQNKTGVSKHDHLRKQVQDVHNSDPGMNLEQVQDTNGSASGLASSGMKDDHHSATGAMYQQNGQGHDSTSSVASQELHVGYNPATGVLYSPPQIEHHIRTMLTSPNFNLFTFLLSHGMQLELIQHHLVMAQQCLVQFTTPLMMHNVRPVFPETPQMRFAANQLPGNFHLPPPHVHQRPPYVHQPSPNLHQHPPSSMHQPPTSVYRFASEYRPYRQVVSMEQNLHGLSTGKRIQNSTDSNQGVKKSVPFKQNPDPQMKFNFPSSTHAQVFNRVEVPVLTQSQDVTFHSQIPPPHSQLQPTLTDSGNTLATQSSIVQRTNLPTTLPSHISLTQEMFHDEPPQEGDDHHKQIAVENSQTDQNLSVNPGQQPPAFVHSESFDEEYEQIEDYSELYSVQEIEPDGDDDNAKVTGEYANYDKTFCAVCKTHLYENVKDENDETSEKYSDHYASDKHKEKTLQYEQYKTTLEKCTITVNAAKDIVATKKKCKYPHLLKKIESIDENLKRFGLSYSLVGITAEWVKGETSVKNIITELTQFIQEYKIILKDILQQAQVIASEDTALLDVGVPTKKSTHYS